MSSLTPDLVPTAPLSWARDAVPRAQERSRSDAGSARLPALDGLRGLMTIFVVVSHYFGEVPHGVSAFCVGWVAVHVFLVMSGFLVGRLIIEKRHTAKFLPVFVLRRVTRTFPIYFVCCGAILGLIAALGSVPWAVAGTPLPMWTYLVFVQNIAFIVQKSIGVHWLSPTWTLALEEQFYVVAPWFFLLLPRAAWVRSLILVIAAGMLCRILGVLTGIISTGPIALLPTSADVLGIGLLLAVLLHEDRIRWAAWSLAIRITPVVLLFATVVVEKMDAMPGGPWFQMFGPPMVATAAACFLLMLVKGAPEARRFHAPVLLFFGDISYAVYLTHLAVLGLLHGLWRGAEPDIDSLAAILVTCAALPLTVLVAWGLTTFIEKPITQWGRSFRWQ